MFVSTSHVLYTMRAQKKIFICDALCLSPHHSYYIRCEYKKNFSYPTPYVCHHITRTIYIASTKKNFSYPTPYVCHPHQSFYRRCEHKKNFSYPTPYVCHHITRTIYNKRTKKFFHIRRLMFVTTSHVLYTIREQKKNFISDALCLSPTSIVL